MAVVELCGVDGAGKTTQAMMFEADGSGVRVPREPSAFPALKGRDLSRWWFEDASLDDLASCFATEIRAADRFIEQYEGSGKLMVVDKGPAMRLVTLTGLAMRKEGLAYEDAFERALPTYVRHVGRSPFSAPRGPSMWLLPDAEYGKTMPRCLYSQAKDPGVFSAEEEASYRQYQSDILTAAEAIAHLLPLSHEITVDASQLDIHRRVRRVLNEAYGQNVPYFAENLQMLVGFAGESEQVRRPLVNYMGDVRGAYVMQAEPFVHDVPVNRKVVDHDVFKLAQMVDSSNPRPEFALDNLPSPEFAYSFRRMFGRHGAIVHCESRFTSSVLDADTDFSSAANALLRSCADLCLDVTNSGSDIKRELDDFIANQVNGLQS